MHDSIQSAIAQLTPFDPRAKGSTLLSGSSTQSYKASAVIRFDGSLNSQGNARIYCNPSPWSDCGAVFVDRGTQGYYGYADSAFAGISDAMKTNGLVLPTTTTAYAAQQLPFKAVEGFGYANSTNAVAAPSDENSTNVPGVRARVVSAGVKVTFAGSTLSDSGSAYCLVTPQHDNLQGTDLTFVQAFTSTKHVRLATRKPMELVFHPVTENMMQYSNGFEDTDLGSHLNQITGGCIAGGWIGHNKTAPTNAIQYSGAYWPIEGTLVDAEASTAAAMQVLYPLCRKNIIPQTKLAGVVSQSGTTTAVALTNYTFSINANAQVTWVGANPLLESGPYTFVNAGAGFATKIQVTYADAGDANPAGWYAMDMFGVPLGLTAQATYNLLYVETPPPILGVIDIVNGVANQSFHVEYVVHVEYIGLLCQGRNTPNIPNPVHQHLITAAAATMKEKHGQSSDGSGTHHQIADTVVDAVVSTIAKAAPEFAIGVVATVAPEAVPVVAPIINRINIGSGIQQLGSLFKRKFL